MKNIFLTVALATASIMAMVSCSSQSNAGKHGEEETPQSQGPKIQTLPSFTMRDISGKLIDIRSFKGRKVFVNLWASWCPPCRAEIPSIEKLSSRISQDKVVFVMLSLDDSFNKAKDFKQESNLQLPVYFPAGDLPSIFNLESIPATFIFNEKGELIKENIGADDYDTDNYLRLLSS